MNSLKRLLGIMFFLILVTSCGPRSLEDFKEEGEGVVRSLIQELQAIHYREQFYWLLQEGCQGNLIV